MLLALVASGDGLRVAPWSAAPFVLLLLAIALLPLAAAHFWHSDRNKALVAALFSAPVIAYLIYLGPETNGASVSQLIHELQQYVAFILLIASLYVVSGGILLRGNLQGKPSTNGAFLAVGVVLANVIGTTGASMLLIRPFLQVNREREHTRHLPIFFIFLVSNLGGLLTPLGDPPLFLGFLNGVDFGWTLTLWPQWLLANGVVLTVFLAWDTMAYGRESAAALAEDRRQAEPLRVRGLVNAVLLAGILLGVLLQSERVGVAVGGWLGQFFACPPLTLVSPWGELLMVVMALLSLALTPRGVRKANEFGWGAIVEVTVLFAGIFVTMVPALALLREHGGGLGVSEPWEFFWLTGALSSFLDNAPTYMTFATLAAGPNDFRWLVERQPHILQAVSCGAVFMGANTYIGNGPNFMVKAIAEEAGYRMPSFFGYMAYSGAILLPTFLIVTLLTFR
ncbi:MAG: sodium:proton antiporter [Gemmataceae bacterium]|nr:sodium:proton antiporter [Gemmataceae bacterium]